jgi:hypothetical protein
MIVDPPKLVGMALLVPKHVLISVLKFNARPKHLYAWQITTEPIANVEMVLEAIPTTELVVQRLSPYSDAQMMSNVQKIKFADCLKVASSALRPVQPYNAALVPFVRPEIMLESVLVLPDCLRVTPMEEVAKMSTVWKTMIVPLINIAIVSPILA